MKHSPAQYAEALHDVLAEAGEHERRAVISHFLNILSKNHDTKFIPRIISRYEKIFLEQRGLKKVDVESAETLSAEIRRQIEEKTGARILLSESVNPSLLAGLIITVDDTVRIDASARTRISTLFA